MFKVGLGLLAALLFLAAAHANADTLPSVSFAPAPPPSAQARYVAGARALVQEMVTAAQEQRGAGQGSVMVLWRGAALAHTSSSQVCSAVNVLASLQALPSHASAVCLQTDGGYTVVLTSAGAAGTAAGGAQ